MQLPGLSRVILVFVAGALTLPWLGRAQVDIGDPPTAPKDISGLPGRVKKLDVTAGFTVNTSSREEMRAFYNGVYAASTGVPANSTSDVTNCTPGTNSTTYQDAVVRRINWFRAAAGLPASITLDSGDGTNDQEAAVMYSANTNISHFPPDTWFCFTSSGAHAASNSNIAIGNAGADAITSYVWDFGGNNSEVGHRRWILYPQTEIMGTGDIPPQGIYEAANATWVFDANIFNARPATTNPFVAWPPPGYIPYQLAYPQWSFAASNQFSFMSSDADLSAVVVTMRSNGVNVVITNQPYQTGFGENTAVWFPTNLDYTSPYVTFPFSGTDTVYSIIVTNIKIGTATTGFAYTVTLFDPNVPGGDYIPTTISGPAQPGVGMANNYTCVPPANPHLTGFQWLVAQAPSGNLFDGAENGANNFIVTASPGYSVTTNGLAASGNDSFYLAMPSATDQILQLNRTLLPATNTQISFASLLGYATTNQIAEVQISSSSGVSWQTIFSQPGTGNSGDTGFSTHSLSLSNYASQPVLLRFIYHLAPAPNGSYSTFSETETSPPVGWFVDNILITNTLQLTNISTTSTASTNFAFTPSQTGGYILEAQPVIFGQFPTGFGPIAQVTAVNNPAPVITLARPAVSAGQVQLNFSVTVGAATTFKLLQADQVTAAWITNASAVLTTNVAGSSYRFTTPVGPSARFYRVQTP